MSDRIAVMSEGRVEQIGAPEEIYDEPGHRVRRRVHRRWPTCWPATVDRRTATARRRSSVLGDGPCRPGPAAASSAGTRRSWSGPSGCRVGCRRRPTPPTRRCRLTGRSTWCSRARWSASRSRPGRHTRSWPTSAPTSELPLLRPGDEVWASWEARPPAGCCPVAPSDRDPDGRTLDELRTDPGDATDERSTTRRRARADGSCAGDEPRAAFLGRVGPGARRPAPSAGSLPRRPAAATTAAAPAAAAVGELAPTTSDALAHLELDRLHRRADRRPDFEDDDRDHGHLHRGHQRQQRVLRQDPASLSRDQSIGARRLRPHRLDGEPHDQPGEVVQPFDDANVPNKANLRRRPAAPSFDPTRKYSLPWRAGMTGHRVQHQDRPARRSPASTTSSTRFEGKITMLTEMRDTVGLFMLGRWASTRRRPPTTTAQPAFDKLAEGEGRRPDPAVHRQRVRETTWRRQPGRGHRLVRATSPRSRSTTRTCGSPSPSRAAMLWSDNFMIPTTTDKADRGRRSSTTSTTRRTRAALTAGIQYISPVEGVGRRAHQDRPGARPTTRSSTRRRVPATAGDLRPRSTAEEDEKFDQPVRRDPRRLSGRDRWRGRRASGRKRRTRSRPGCCLARGWLFLFFFFFFPLYTLFRMSLSTVHRPLLGPTLSSAGTGPTTPTRSRSTATSSSGRSCTPWLATLLALLIAYPLAYVIAFRGGTVQEHPARLVVVPFFTNFLIRTLAWKTILGDQGTVVELPRATSGSSADGRLLRPSWRSSAG